MPKSLKRTLLALFVTGNAVINGGAVSVDGAAGTYTHGTTYTFLAAAGGITGTFDSINDNLAFFDAHLGYSGTEAFFTLYDIDTDFATVGGGGIGTTASRWAVCSSINLAVDGIDTHSLRSLVGGRTQFHSQSVAGRWHVTPELRAMWMHEFLETSSIVNASFAGVGGSGFAAQGLDLGRDWAVAGFGLSSQLSERWSLRADYNSQFNSHQVLHVGSGVISYVW